MKVFTDAILSTTSIPSITLPNAAYSPSRCGAALCMIKNWDPAEFGIMERAIESTPASCFNWFVNPLLENSPLMLYPGFPVPFPRGHPP